MRWLVGLALLVSACSSDSTGPTADLNGIWSLTASYNNAQTQTTCTLNGQATLAQSGSTFTGQVTGSVVSCANPSGTTVGNADGPLTGGQVHGTVASYSDGSCNYSGTVSGSPANRVQGSVSCQIASGGTTYPFTGTWQLSR